MAARAHARPAANSRCRDDTARATAATSLAHQLGMKIGAVGVVDAFARAGLRVPEDAEVMADKKDLGRFVVRLTAVPSVAAASLVERRKRR